MLALDLGVFNRKSHEIKLKEALTWSAVWIGMAFAFCGVVWWLFDREASSAAAQAATAAAQAGVAGAKAAISGHEAVMLFLTGYLLEKSLSVDNLFIFALLFGYFKVPANLQHRVLFWGIIGALVLRAAFILAGVALIEKFHWMMYVFGVIVLVSGIKMAMPGEKNVEPERNPLLRLLRRFMPVTDTYQGQHFFVKREGRTWATPLFVVLIAIETTDLVFAVDSIPAVIAVTRDPFLVYTSNVFAILGLRALYFALAGLLNLFHYLGYGLAVVLSFIGIKMLLVDVVKINPMYSLAFVIFCITAAIVASLLWPKKDAVLPPASTA